MNERACPTRRWPVGLWIKAITALRADSNLKMANIRMSFLKLKCLDRGSTHSRRTRTKPAVNSIAESGLGGVGLPGEADRRGGSARRIGGSAAAATRWAARPINDGPAVSALRRG